MKRFCRLSLCSLFVLWMIAVSAAGQTPQPSVLVIEGGTLIDGNGGPPVPDALVIIRGDKIETVSRKGQTPYPAGAQVIRADGKFVLPGFQDAHQHYSNVLAEMHIYFGITSVYNTVIGGPAANFRREAINRGVIPGPRLFGMSEWIVDVVAPERVVYNGIENPQEKPITPERARERARRGLIWKPDMLYAKRGLSFEAYKAIADEAHKVGLPLLAQAIGPHVYAKEAILAGVDVIEHASGVSISVAKDPEKWKGWGQDEIHSLDLIPFVDMDDKKAEELIKLAVDHNFYIEPDIVAMGRGLHRQAPEWEAEDFRFMSQPGLAYLSESTRFKWMINYRYFAESDPDRLEQRKKALQNFMRFIGMFARAGGKLMAGTDAHASGWATPGIAVHREMELFVEAGLTPMQAILTATRYPAEGFRVLDRLGTVEKGKLADLVILTADPLQDIRNTKKIDQVIMNGKVMDRTFHPWFGNPYAGGDVEAPEWFQALKRVTEQGIRVSAGLRDDTQAFGQPCPGIESISPEEVSEGSSGITLTIRGINFTKKSVVYWGERAIPSRLVSATELQATISPGLIARAGIFSLQVRNPGPHLSQPRWGTNSNRANLVVNFKDSKSPTEVTANQGNAF
ncbi:MAG: amidohydrolase family protein [Acidobacteria bacterium]|nr:amidohydrolase family protein [Acidobacteriota bacterium]